MVHSRGGRWRLPHTSERWKEVADGEMPQLSVEASICSVMDVFLPCECA